MDTSPEYIKQCEKAGEIQRGKHFPVTMGQRIIFWENDIFAQINLLSTNWKIVWLPRQDQLQEMIRETESNSLIEICRLYKFVMNNISLMNLSMEQLWLSFVMSKKYGKSFDGNEWIRK